MQFVIPGVLARSCRPGWPMKENIPGAAVEKAVTLWREAGIKSIICLLDDDQLGYYRLHKEGLLARYADAGFRVAHVPARDHLRPPLTEEQLNEIIAAFRDLPKPVLVHCSAGMDRTGLAVDRILQER